MNIHLRKCILMLLLPSIAVAVWSGCGTTKRQSSESGTDDRQIGRNGADNGKRRINTTYCISGMVSSSDSAQMVRGTQIRVQRSDGTLDALVTITNETSSGMYTISGLMPGEYHVLVASTPSHWKCNESSKTLEITSMNLSNIDFQLIPVCVLEIIDKRYCAQDDDYLYQLKRKDKDIVYWMDGYDSVPECHWTLVHLKCDGPLKCKFLCRETGKSYELSGSVEQELVLHDLSKTIFEEADWYFAPDNGKATIH